MAISSPFYRAPLLELLRQRPDLAKHFMQQNQLMMPQP